MAYGLRYPILSWKWSEVEKLIHVLLQHQTYQILITDCDPIGLSQYDNANINTNKCSYSQIDFRKPTVLLIGSEAVGVSDEVRLGIM